MLSKNKFKIVQNTKLGNKKKFENYNSYFGDNIQLA